MVEMVVTVTISLRVPEEEVDEVIRKVMSNLRCEVLDVRKYPESEFVEVTADFCEVVGDG